MKITESTLKRIIREELKKSSKNIAESAIVPGKTIVKGRPNLKSEFLVLNDDPDIDKIRVRVVAYKGNPNHSAIGDEFIVKQFDIDDDHPLKVNLRKVMDAKPASKDEEKPRGPGGGSTATRASSDQEYAMKMAQAIEITYSTYLGSVIDKSISGRYGSIPKDAAESVGWARLYPDHKGLGLIHRPNAGDLQTMRRTSLKLPAGAGNQHAATMLKSAFGIITGAKPMSWKAFADQIFSALAGIDKASLDAALPIARKQLAAIERKFEKSERKRDKAVKRYVGELSGGALDMFAPEKGEVTFQAIKDNIAGLYGGGDTAPENILASQAAVAAKAFINQSKIINDMISDRPNVKALLHSRGVHPKPEAVSVYLK